MKEKLEGRAYMYPPKYIVVPRAGMRRLLIVTVVVAGAILTFLISTNMLNYFCDNTSATSVSLRLHQEFNKTQGISFVHGRRREGETEREYPAWTEERPSTRESMIITQSGCDYTFGRWVKGGKTPLYTGTSCKQWLSAMWACKLMPGRPNFEYENYEWQPHGCNLPEFDSGEFLMRMQNKVLAFVGDSIGRQQFESLMCMLTHGSDDVTLVNVGKQYGLQKPRGEIRPSGWAYRFSETNTTIVFYWSASLCEILPLNDLDPDTHFAMNLDLPATFIQRFLPIMDVLVLNTGHHWNKGKMLLNKWVLHTGRHPATSGDYRNMRFARNHSLHQICSWFDQQLAQNKTRAQIFLRSLSPRHFFNGEWDSGGRCDENPAPVEEKNVSGRGVTDAAAASAVRGTRVRLLDITYASQFRDEAHISKYRPNMQGQDCLHWCLPGVPDLWNELLYAYLLYPNPAQLQD